MRYHPQADRAKIFAPFDALVGFREALARKERIIVPKVELSEDMKEILDYKFQQIKPDDIISIIYYDNDEYVKVSGIVTKYSILDRTITIVHTKIPVANIYDIQTETITYSPY